MRNRYGIEVGIDYRNRGNNGFDLEREIWDVDPARAHSPFEKPARTRARSARARLPSGKTARPRAEANLGCVPKSASFTSLARRRTLSSKDNRTTQTTSRFSVSP
ncbi:hypothetical protein AgCh_022902 [Apium graveolens]